MFTRQGVRKGVVVLGLAAVAAVVGVDRRMRRSSGRVVFADGPIGVSIVFGDRHERVVVPTRVVRRAALPARYRPGMSLYQLDLYLERIEREYDYYRRMHPRDAYIHHGWSPRELRAYVRWLKDERRFLRDERRRLERGMRGWERDRDRDWGDDGRGRGRW
jgi:hypothetical protein